MDLKQRLKEFIAHGGLTIKGFERSLGMSNGYVNSISKGLGDEYMNKLIENYPNLNVVWLLTGEGDMLTDHIETKAVEGVDGDLTAKNAIRFYPNIPVTASHIEDMPEPSYEDMGYQLMKIQGWEGCVAYTAVGDSMYPRISNGDIVVFSKWRESYISNGEIYLIVTRNGDRSIKYLTFSREDEDGEKYYTCTSANPDQKRYAPFEIQGSQIVSLYIVHGCVKRFKM